MNENNKNIVDSLSEFLNVVSVIQSQAAAVENISGASKTLNNIIRNINKFPKDLGEFNSDNVKNTLTGVSAAVKMLHSTNSDINKALKDSIFNPIFFDNSIFKETERFADPSLIESIKNLAAQNGETIDVNTFEKEKVNLYIENFLTTMKYTNQVFTAVKSFLNMCKSMNEIDPNNTGVSNVTSVFKKSLLSIKLIVGYISNIMDDPDMKNTLDYIAKFQSEVNAYEGREAELMYLQEKMSKGKLDRGDSRRLNEHYKSKPTNIFECLTSLYGGILEILKSINQFNKLEPANPAALAFNLQLSIWNLNIVISMIPSILKSINTKELKEIALDLSPKNIETIKSTTTNEDNATQKSDITKTVIDQMTPFQLIQHIFNLIENLNNIKVVNPVKVKIALLSLQVTFKWISKQILNIAASFKEMFNDKEKKDIIDGGKNAIESVAAITGNLAKITTDIETAAKKSFIVLLCFPAILLLVSTIKIITKVITGSFKNLNEETKNTRKNIDNVSVTILDVLKIGLIIISIATLSVILLPATIVATLVIGSIIAFVYLLNVLLKICKIRLKDLLTLTVLNIAIGLLITLSLGVLALSKIGKKIDWKSLLIMMGAILMVSVFSILIGFAAMSIISVIGLAMVGLMALIMLIGVLFVIAGMLYVLQIVELDTEIIKGNIKFLLGLCEEIAVIVKDKLNKESLKAIGIATLNLGALLPMTVVLLLLAGGLWLLQHIDLNRDKIRETVETVIGTATSIIDMIFGEKEEPETEKSDKTWIGGLLEGVGGFMGNLKVVLDAILAVGFLATTVASVAIILLIGKLLNKVSELNIDENISQKVGKIIETAKNISKQVLGTSDSTAQVVKQEEEKSWLGKTWDNIKGFGGKVINTATSLISNIGAAGVLATILPSVMMLGSIVDLIQSINDLKLDPNINNKVANIVDLAKNITSQVSSSRTIGSIDEDKVDLFGEYVDDSVKYFKGINDLKIDNVKSLADMYVKMGEFMDKLSDAPISEIADALVNKISPALSDINNNLDKRTTSATSQQNTQQTSTTSQQNTQQIDYTSILENIEDLLQNIKQKININPQVIF